MEPEYVGFCRGCNSFSEHLRIRPVKNNNTGTTEVSMFCPDCRKRFGLFPYDKREIEARIRVVAMQKSERTLQEIGGNKYDDNGKI